MTQSDRAMKYRWDSDRSTMPVLLVGWRYPMRRGRGSAMVLRARFSGGQTPGARYYRVRNGDLIYEKNDFALVNKLRHDEGQLVPDELERGQLELL